MTVRRQLAHSDRTYEAMKARLIDHIGELFPVEGKRHRLDLKKVWIEDNLNPDDWTSQKASRMAGTDWGVPLKADLELRDLQTGKTINRARIKLIDVPRLTNRGSYIVGGTEYMFPLQKRLKSGAYTRTGKDGELRTFFNMSKGRNFHLGMHPEKGYFQLQVDSSKDIRLYSILRALGVQDADMMRAWGREVFMSNRVDSPQRSAKDVERAYRLMSYGEEAPAGDVSAALSALLAETRMDGGTSQVTLGSRFTSAGGKTLLAASTKMLKIARGEAKEDNRDSLIHNEIVDLSDYVVERFNDPQFGNRIKRTMRSAVDRKDKVTDIINRDAFQNPMTSIMTKADVSRSPTQGNPLGMISDYTAITVRGEGGIQTDHALTRSVRALDPSHMGFLDPAHTPEGSQIGTTLHLALGTRKQGKDLVTDVLDTRSKKVVSVTPSQMFNATVAFPEALDHKSLKIKGPQVKASRKGEIIKVKPQEVDYAIMAPEHMFDLNTGAVPFISHNNGVRLMTAAKMGVQSKPLVNREAPLVQVSTPGGGTVEKNVGESFSPASPVAGTVSRVTKDAISIKGPSGEVKVQIPNYFPLNNNNFLHATPKVKVGDRVKRGQSLADTNYTKDDTLAQGTNLRVAYTPYKGMNFEDGVVISEQASQKMTSEHVYQQPFQFDADTLLNLNSFKAYFPAKMDADASKNLDDDGVIKKGSKVEYGTILVAAMRKQSQGTESQRMARVSKILAKDYRDISLTWPKHTVGEVLDVVRRSKEIVVHIRTEEAMRVGDKLVGRHGNKGVVVHVIPDKEMPKDAKGNTLDVLMNPNGVVSRMNLGQILETTASKISEKTGKPFVARGFGDDSSTRIARELKKHGLEDHETIYDPTENREIPGVLVGKQYIYKLEHQSEKKISARGGGPTGISHGEGYTSEMQPGRGAGVGGRAIGSMELYGLLAHGATKNLHEMYTYKSDFDADIWRAIESGDQLPNPKPTHSQQKFTAMLQGMGVNVDTGYDSVKLTPFLDKHLKDVSRGELTNHRIIRGKDLKEEAGGVFDPEKTGGVQGDRWSHIKLPEPLPNPTFEKAILSLLKMKKSEFSEVVSGKKEIDGKTGGTAIASELKKIDVKSRLKSAKKEAKKARGSSLNKLHKEIRYLNTLDKTGIKPEEYVIKNVPVIPPKFRPIYTLPDGNLRVSDVNNHYQALLQLKEEMDKKKDKPEFAERYEKLKSSLYPAVGGIMGLDKGIVERKDIKGLATTIGGSGSPKSGYFHSSLLKKRQDVSATAVVTVNPKLGLDDIGVPEQLAWKTFRPFLVKELRSMGMTPLQAKEAIKNRTPMARESLKNVMAEKHVIINRAPTLHKFSIIALKPKLVGGYALEANPFIVNGMNMDFDGDTVGLHVPISGEANAEASEMLPSKHLYKPGTGALQPKLGQEYVLGLFRISVPGQKAIAKRFSGAGEVLAMVRNRKIDPTTSISIMGIGPTTPGRVLINSVLPLAHRDYKLIWTSKVIQQKLKDIDKKDGRKAFTQALQDLANIGRRWAYLSGSSFLLSDLRTMNKQRNEAYNRADIQAERVRMGSGSEAEKKKKIVEIYSRVQNRLTSKINLKNNSTGKNNNITDMSVSGARGGPSQVRQLVSNIGVMLDHENNPMSVPVKGTYTEGLDSAEYFQHLYGSRKGMIDKSQSVKDPGAITKQMAVSAAGFRVTLSDCNTKQGIMESTVGTDAVDRYLAEQIPGVGKRNTLITTSILNGARSKGLKKIKVRSPLSCTASSGVCSKCFGLDEEGKPPSVGDFVGIKEMHGLTEPTTQLAMQQFHTGGVLTGKSSDTSTFDRAKQLFTMPDIIRDKAILAEVPGRVDSVTKSAYGGWVISVAGKNHRAPRKRQPTVKAGDMVEAGQLLTDGNAQPQDVLRLRGLRAMQMQLRNDIQGVYAGGNVRIKAKTIETPVRILTETVRIMDPGGHPSMVSGDHSNHSQVDAWNRENPSKKPVTYMHVLPGSEQLPHKGDDWVQRMSHNRIKQVLQEAPAMGSEAPLKGGSPFAPLIFGKRIEPSMRGLTNG